MTKDVSGRLPSEPGSRPADQAAARLGPARFHPSRGLDHVGEGIRPILRGCVDPHSKDDFELWVDRLASNVAAVAIRAIRPASDRDALIDRLTESLVLGTRLDISYHEAREAIESAFRDRDGSRNGRDREDGLDGEAATARAAEGGIAQDPPHE